LGPDINQAGSGWYDFDEKGVAAFHVLRRRRNEAQVFLYAFDLLELNGTDLRREPIEVRKATLASILRKARHGVRLNEHLEHPRVMLSSGTPARWGWRDPRSCMRWYARRSGKLGSSTIRLADRFHAFRAKLAISLSSRIIALFQLKLRETLGHPEPSGSFHGPLPTQL
jgi:ATP dependent DNA ligase domain